MSIREAFHKKMINHGGRFSWEAAPEQVKSAYKEIAERADDLVNSARRVIPRLPQIYFDFIYNPKINAFATRDTDRYFIGITTGALFMLRAVIGRMLSDPRVFQFVGDPLAESSALQPISDYSTNADAMLKINADAMLKNGRPLSPRDPIRVSYADFLQDQAIMFLIGHELTHITHGHVDFLMSKHDIKFTSELEWFGRGAGHQAIERQALEQDADRRSIISRIDSLRVTSENPNNTKPPWASEGVIPAQLIRDWSVSLNILFRLFGDTRFSRVDINESNHPPFPLRQVMCEAAADWAITNQWDPSLSQAAQQALSFGRLETERAFSIILAQPFSSEGLMDAFSPVGRDYAVRLQEHWNSELVERLRPFSYEF